MNFSFGHIELGGREFPIGAVYLEKGKVQLQVQLPPSLERLRGHIHVFGGDGKRICMGKVFEVPPHETEVVFTYGLEVVLVHTGDQVTDLSTLPGW